MHGADVRTAADAVFAFLRPRVDRDWSVPVPDLDFTVASVVAHAGECGLWYALDLTGGPDDAAFRVGIRPDAEPSVLLRSLRVAAHLCATAVDAHPPTARGFHPAGPADPSGFAAMACDELLVHCHDAATGLAAAGSGPEFRPDAELAGRVLARLFPWHDPGSDPWTTLLWANGRLDLPGAPRRVGWRWHCAPLDEWDGAVPGQSVPGQV